MSFHPRHSATAALLLLAAVLLTGCSGVVVNNNTPSQSSHTQTVATTSTAAAANPNPVTAGLPAAEATAPSPAASEEAQVPAGQLFTAGWFSAASPWNTTINSLPTDVRSAQLMHRSMERVGVIEQPGNLPPKLDTIYTNAGLYINTTSWTDPVVQGGVETPLHCRQTHCGEGNKITQLPVPADVSPNPLYDGWFTIISADGKTAYDLWRARRLPNGSISYQYMRVWNLDGRGYGSPGQVSARGSGLPLFAGLIRPTELQAGQIDHALAISVPAPASRYYVQPASSTDGNGATNSLPEGARIRLKATVTLPRNLHLTVQQRRYASALLWTLRNYGAIVVGRAATPTLYGQEGVTASLLKGNELQWLHLSDFEVVQLGQEYQYPSPYQAQTGPGGSYSAVEGN